jgi:hypothetical protein
MQSLLLKLEADIADRKARHREHAPMLRAVAVAVVLVAMTYQVGARSGQAASSVYSAFAGGAPAVLEHRVEDLQGKIELQQTYIDKLERAFRNSAHYGITADLALKIEEVALAESIDPRIAFELVRVESRFNERAVSPVGALGLTQLMPRTAEWLSPGITRPEIFERETNLRLGFRFLSYLLNYYDGDLRLALLAYNRGPGTVDRLLAEGRDPGNGYARMVMGR